MGRFWTQQHSPGPGNSLLGFPSLYAPSRLPASGRCDRFSISIVVGWFCFVLLLRINHADMDGWPFETGYHFQ